MNIFHKVTLKYLKENRTRTLVTIVGIILSASMFTAVTTMVSSLSQYLINYTIYNDGNWYGVGYGVSARDKEKLTSDPHTKNSVSMELLGFSSMEDETSNEAKPYICIYGIQSDFTEMMPVHLTQGRLPENSQEILLPEHLKTNGGITYALNDSLSLSLGTRMDNEGNILTNSTAYLNITENSYNREPENKGVSEKLIPGESRTYTIVGFYERPSFEDYDAPGYTALTIGDNSSKHSYNIYLLTDSRTDTVSLLENMFAQTDVTDYKTNSDLLRYYGYSGESSYNRVLYSLGSILILIIMFGSISLIYNAFSISVSERTRQFGLLASIGATKRQLTGSVIFEALFLSGIGIPLGVLSGILGIGITLFLIRDMMADVFGFYVGNYAMQRFSMIFGPAKEISLEVHPSLGAIAIAVAVSLLTVVISAYIPAKRAMKKPAIEAIRQTSDITIRSRKIRTLRLTQKFFGFEGMIATKNYKRSRRKYRATVISLFLSIVLFISASSFCAYLTFSAESVVNDKDYDLAYYFHSDTGFSIDAIRSELSKAQGVTDSTYALKLYFNSKTLTNQLSPEMQEYLKKLDEQEEGEYKDYDVSPMNLYVIFLADNEFRNYLKEQHLPENDYFNTAEPKAIIIDSLRLYQENEKKFYRFGAFDNAADARLSAYLTEDQVNYSYAGTGRNEKGELCSLLIDTDSYDKTYVPLDKCLEIPFSIEGAAKEAPEFFPQNSDCVRLFYPYSMIDRVFSGMKENTLYYEISDAPLSENQTTELLFQCEDHNTAYSAMINILADKNLSSSSLMNYAASKESQRAMLSVVNVFSYGFIILISLIAAANVFNTISTNINLRRREFAMLKSIGMTPKSFTKMMNFECLLYGFKGLAYGLPVSFFVTWMIYNSISEGLEMAFFVPWYSIAIAVGSVFLVVSATMVYSMKRISKENTIDALKNENL